MSNSKKVSQRSAATDKVGRKKYHRIVNDLLSSSEDEKEEQMYFLVGFVDGNGVANEYSIEAHKVKIDKENKKLGSVKHRGKWYNCELLKYGDIA